MAFITINIAMPTCPKCTMPDFNALNARAFYMGLGSVVYGGLAAGLVGILDAPVSDGSEDHRYQECALAGASPGDACPAPSADDETQNEMIFGISIAVVVVNFMIVLYLLATMNSTKWSNRIFKVQAGLEAINVGLFAGIVGWFNASDDLLDAANVENSVFFGEGNVWLIALFGLIMACVDAAFFWGFKMSCDAKGKCEVPM